MIDQSTILHLLLALALAAVCYGLGRRHERRRQEENRTGPHPQPSGFRSPVSTKQQIKEAAFDGATHAIAWLAIVAGFGVLLVRAWSDTAWGPWSAGLVTFLVAVWSHHFFKKALK
jgi:hypothetical protein